MLGQVNKLGAGNRKRDAARARCCRKVRNGDYGTNIDRPVHSPAGQPPRSLGLGQSTLPPARCNIFHSPSAFPLSRRNRLLSPPLRLLLILYTRHTLHFFHFNLIPESVSVCVQNSVRQVSVYACARACASRVVFLLREFSVSPLFRTHRIKSVSVIFVSIKVIELIV